MFTAIRNLDPDLYRQFKARSVLEGVTIASLMNQAIRDYLEKKAKHPPLAPKRTNASARVFRPGYDDAESSDQFDVHFWNKINPTQKFKQTWEITYETWRLTKQEELTDESRFPRHTACVNRS